MVIRYADGSQVEGSVHRLDGGTMRATVTGVDDAVEYTFLQGRWISEIGTVVTFEFTAERGRDFFGMIPVRIGDGAVECAAGGDCAVRRISGPCAGPVN